MGNEVCRNTFEVVGSRGAWLEETLLAFVLELIEVVCVPGFVTADHLHAPIPTDESADEFV